MQEEVEHKTVNLAIQTAKVTLKTLIKGLSAWQAGNNKKERDKNTHDAKINGKQTVKQLIGQDKGVSGIDIADGGIREFERIAKKYGVDFAIVKDKSSDKPRYTVFFKARDKEAIDRILNEYGKRMDKKASRKEKGREIRASILQKLKKFKEIVAGRPRKERRKEQER